MTLDDAENDNDSNDKGVITGIKVSNMGQSFWQFLMTKKYILDSVFECRKTLQELAWEITTKTGSTEKSCEFSLLSTQCWFVPSFSLTCT